MNNESMLARQVRENFSKKVYPNPKDPIVLAKLEDGMRQLRETYIGRSYPWILNGHTLYSESGVCADEELCFRTHDPNETNLVTGYFPTPVLKSMDLPMHLTMIRDAGRNFFKTVPWQQRIELLRMISCVAQERFWLLCASKGYEQGQNFGEQIGETDEEVDFPLANAWYLERLNSEVVIPSPQLAGEINARRYVPHGIFLDISPFNFPGAIPMDMMTKALAMGNAVIEKSSPKSALSGYLVFETVRIAFERLGINWRGVINYCPGGADVVDAFLSSPLISGASFTGSTAVLASIRKKHGTMLREGWAGKAPLVFGSAETSGVNPFVVCESADPEYAALEYAKAIVGRQGQKCSSARVAMIHTSLYSKFMTAVRECLDALVYGDVKTGADIGGVATALDRANLNKAVRRVTGPSGFADVGYEKKIPHLKGFDFPPTILIARQNDIFSRASEIMNTEIFGPVSTVLQYQDLRTVELLLVHSNFALTGSFFTSNQTEFVRLLELMPAGNVYWNRKCTGALVDTECFGGLRSASSPVGIKGYAALNLFGSQQTFSGKYPVGATQDERAQFIDTLESQGCVFGKY